MEQLIKLVEIIKLLDDKKSDNQCKKDNNINDYFLNKKVIIRTYSAGVHFGELIEKDGKEVILKNSRRLWSWTTANRGISLSEIANEGVYGNNSKICSPISLLWLEAIEIIPCTAIAIQNIEGQNEYKA